MAQKSAAIDAKPTHIPTAGMTWLLWPALRIGDCGSEAAMTAREKHKSPRAGSPTLTRVGRAGHGRHGGEAPALWGGPVMSALTFWSFLVKQKGQKKDGTTAEVKPRRGDTNTPR